MIKDKTKNIQIQYIFFFSVLILSTVALFKRLLVPIGIAYVLYAIISPLVPSFMKLGLSRRSSVILLFITFLFSTFYPIAKVIPTIIEESKNFQNYLPEIESSLKRPWEKTQTFIKTKTGFDFKIYLEQSIDSIQRTITKFLLELPKFFASLLEWIFLIPLFVFFLLLDGRKFKIFLLKFIPNALFERTYYLTYKFNKQLGDYIFAKFIEAFIISFSITSGLLFLEIRFAFLLGLIAGITNIIPYIGPILGMIPCVVLVLAEHGMGTTLWSIISLYLLANAIDIIFIFPILVSKIVNLHLLIVVISVILGSQYLGILGMVISIPCVAAIKLVVTEFYKEIYHD